MRRFLLLVVFAAVLPGFDCKKRGADSYVYSIFVDESLAKVEGLELGGKPLTVAAQQPTGKSFEVTLAAKEMMVEKNAVVSMTTTCGVSRLPAKITVGITKSDSRSGEERERGLLAKGKNDLTATAVLMSPPRVADVYLDTEGSAAPVTVGTMAVDPAKSPHRLPLGPCPTADEVKIGGASVGRMPVVPRKTAADDKPGTAFVDVRGGHCYESKLHLYADKDKNTENMARSAPKRLEPQQRVYVVEIDDFLKAPPETVTSKDALPSRTEIRRCGSTSLFGTGGLTPSPIAPAKKPKPKK
ncbi:MAG: hypothetical protein KF819_22385 [Labilithrix sp.]|nr:hypothetical protein [Labilithrix sp.]